jgi:uncharacterized phiE125 gp8 family phage protein
MLSLDPLGLDSAMLDEARAFVRIETGDDDPSLPAAVLAAIGHAENFTRSILIRRNAHEIVSASSGWQILQAAPVQSVVSVTAIPAEGATFVLASDMWEAKIGSRGEAYVRILQPGSAGRAEIACVTGLATDWASLPEALRLGLLRLCAHFHSHRDAADGAAPPAAALALLLPWRRMRVG